MYINPFWCGVIATILTELTGIIGYAIYLSIKKINKLLTFYNYKFLDVDVRLFFMPFY